jgi:hypothetical protein
MTIGITRYAVTTAVLIATACSAAGEDVGASDGEISSGTILNLGALAHPGSCMDARAAGTVNGTQIQEFACNGTGAQAFKVVAAAGGAVSLVNTHASKCVDVAGAGTADRTKVQLFDCNGTGAQSFVFRRAASGFVTIVNTNSNKCLDVAADNPADGTVVQLFQCNGTSAQLWNPAAIGAAPPPSGAPGGTPAPACGAATNLRPGDRVITITNECPGETIAVGVNGGFVQDCNNGACPAGTTCSTGRSPPGCFFDLPAPACGSSVLASGASATFVLDAPPVNGIQWSGNLYASTQCAANGAGCRTAQCVTSANGKTVVGACPNGTGPQGPTTLAELTLSAAGVDFYDVSSINGVNAPVSMGPIGQGPNGANGYSCGTAGGIAAAGGLQGCSWAFDPTLPLNGASSNQSAVLRAVTPGGAACASDAQCPAGQVCGTALAFGGPTGAQTCGTQVAWWTADELCAATGNAEGGAVACSRGVAGQGNDANLYGCDGPNATSGFSTNASALSCGCPTWVVGGAPLALAPGFACHSDNAAWEAIAEPWAAFLKNACPTAYSFPFDDATSTFTCATPNGSASSPNSVGYAITFCPGGRTGF